MDENGFWTVFRDTGDPMCYMIGRRLADKPAASGQETDLPPAGDAASARAIAVRSGIF